MMKKPLLVSLAAAALLTGANVNAASMFDRMTQMETEMKSLQAELDTVKAQKAAEAEEAAAKADVEEAVVDEDEDTDEDAVESDDEDEDEDDEESELDEQLTELNKRTSGNHLKFGVDFRTSVDSLSYKMADGSKESNGAVFSNRLWLNMNWAATSNLSFTGRLAYNKTYGGRSGVAGNQAAGFETFDWIVSQNPNTDGVVRVSSAYFFYRNDTFLGTNIPWTFSIGRRPSTNGHLVNLRDDDVAASPMGHSINVEFDGLSAKFSVVEDIGMYFKFCAGRGLTDAAPGLAAAPYAKTDDVNNIDLGGLIFVPYDDGQYSIGTQYYYAANLIDADPRLNPANTATPNPSGFETVGGLHSITANFVMSGIGDEWSDFLDDTTFFISGAMSISNPDSNSIQGMFGKQIADPATGKVIGFSDDKYDTKKGYSGWVGLQFPSLISEDGRWGLEYNYGSEYWRAITYSEDTLIGSKLATRGNAYEVYFTEPLIDDIFSFQVRYTYIDYEHAGSNGFFGTSTGATNKVSDSPSNQIVDTASDLRAYLRYRF